jgi:vacuolar protein sorting-associated protein 45
MNVVAATRAYVDRVVSDPNNPGMKVLLLDAETTKTVANVYSQTEILERDVFLVERLDQTRSHEPMHHLKAAAFIRPTAANFALLRRELAEPKFGEYHLYFANVAPRAQLRELAESDDLEMVRQVQEFYADFVPINDALFTLNQRQSLRLSTTRPTADLLRRNVDGVLSCLLALKVQPACVRYSAASSVAKAIATEVSRRVKSDGIFHFKQRHSHETGWPLLLIMDRADDCVTPLLSQWTYQAMVHELLGVNNNRVRLKGTQSARGDPNLDEVVLHNTDAFYATHQHANFGDLGTAVKALLDDYQHQTKMNEHISNIEDMQSFLDRYPAFRSKSLNVSKHVALISELSKLVETHALMDISQLEQELACHDDGGTQRREVLARINDARVGGPDKLRLALLYALRYEQQGHVPEIKLALVRRGVQTPRPTRATRHRRGRPALVWGLRDAPGLELEGGGPPVGDLPARLGSATKAPSPPPRHRRDPAPRRRRPSIVRAGREPRRAGPRRAHRRVPALRRARGEEPGVVWWGHLATSQGHQACEDLIRRHRERLRAARAVAAGDAGRRGKE